MKTPTPEDVKNVYKYTYILYDKYKDISHEHEFNQMHDEIISIEKKYPFSITRKMLIALTETIDEQYNQRQT